MHNRTWLIQAGCACETNSWPCCCEVVDFHAKVAQWWPDHLCKTRMYFCKYPVYWVLDGVLLDCLQETLKFIQQEMELLWILTACIPWRDAEATVVLVCPVVIPKIENASRFHIKCFNNFTCWICRCFYSLFNSVSRLGMISILWVFIFHFRSC